jgi:ferredoxin-NADP reductase
MELTPTIDAAVTPVVEHGPRASEFDVVVEKVTPEADGVISLRLAGPGAGPLPSWGPGAHIDVVVGGGLIRQYSLCGDAEDGRHWTIAVLREAQSRGGSEWIHTGIQAGDRLRVRGPWNNFPLVMAEEYVFIAGGIGITPLLPMIRQVDRGDSGWNLLYGGRRRASMAFLGQLEPFGDRVRIVPEDEFGLLDLDTWIASPRPGTLVYCCGPEALIAAVEERCSLWPTGSLHVERFHPRPGALDGENTAFEVVCARSGLTVTVGADEAIVTALERNGVYVPTSCAEGICGTCQTAVVGGVPDHRDSFLVGKKREDHTTIMVCCSRARTSRLVLDL